MKDLYLVIETGYEGIEGIYYPTKSPKRAVERIKTLREKAVKDRIKQAKEMNKFWRKEGKPDIVEAETLTKEEEQHIKNFFCVQRWNGKEFVCVCGELGVSPSERMLR